MKIAIIGAGISGLGAAWLLHNDHDITVFESEGRVGGHTNTVDIVYDGTPLRVDTGFIVYNELNYPNLTALFGHLGVETRASDMSFAFSTPGSAQEWSGASLDSVFAWRRNLINPKFVGMLRDILRFNRLSSADLEAGRLRELSLGDYLVSRSFGTDFQALYLLPMGAAIWSTSISDMLDFPAQSFVRFFANHKLINSKSDRPQWRTVVGGSNAYLEPLTRGFQNRIRLNSSIANVSREPGCVLISFVDGSSESFDHVIFACHSDQARNLLSDPIPQERNVLDAVRYGPNRVYLHRDEKLMPQRQKTWSSWNYICNNMDDGQSKPASVTYWMNRLQGIDQDKPVFVSLNPAVEPAPELTFGTFDYMHPLFDGKAIAAQTRLPEIQGVRNTWFCGAWTGYGFHEDGLSSGLDVAERLGGLRPWSRMVEDTSVEPLMLAAD